MPNHAQLLEVMHYKADSRDCLLMSLHDNKLFWTAAVGSSSHFPPVSCQMREHRKVDEAGSSKTQDTVFLCE